MVLTAGCTHALRAPRPLAPPGAPVPPAASAPALLAQAEASFARRPDADAVRKADALFIEAATADEADIAGLVGAIRVKVWLIDHDEEAGSRRSLASQAVGEGQLCLRRAPDNARCDYGLALALGLQARETRSLGNLKSMIEHLKRAIASDPRIDLAGPERVLASVLVSAPGWPIGPGDSEEGLKHARAAAALFPDYPPNQTTLAEALKANGEGTESRAAASRALELAREREARGDPDAPDWVRSAEKLTGQARSS